MKKAISGRQTGKTEKLIILSANNQIPIVVHNQQSKELIIKRAKDKGINIPEPISIHDLMDPNYLNTIDRIPKVLVDDSEYVLEVILRKCKVGSIEAISICTDDQSDELI